MFALRASNRVLSASRFKLHAAAISPPQRSISSPSFFQRLFNIPKGFKKFYPKEGGRGNTSGSAKKTKTSEKEADKLKSSSSDKDKKKKSGGGGGPGGNDNGDLSLAFRAALVLAGGAALYMNLTTQSLANEISWQEFVYMYLEPKKVQQVIVVNKQYAKVLLKDTSDISASNSNVDDHGDNFKPDFSFREDDVSKDNTDRAIDEREAARRQFMERMQQKAANSPKFFNIGSVESFERRMDEAQKGVDAKDQVPVTYETQGEWMKEFVHFLPSLLLLGFLGFTLRSMGSGAGGPMSNIFKAGKSNAKMVKKESISTTFKDVAGCDGAKKEVMEFVEFLRSPKKFVDLGATIPKGALLSGPPGTGKTLLAKATAGEADVPFYSISGSDFVEMFVGVGASRVRDLFKEARNNSPCIVFIDEIDAVGRARGNSRQGGNDERENTLNQLLIEMDGFGTDANVIILAGTNRPDMLDSALTRPGRFDRTIAVELPDIRGRKQIYDVHLRKLKLEKSIEEMSPRLAALTPGFSGADIANICNEAAITAGREDSAVITMAHFEKATDRIIGGLESTRIISPEERKIVAYHEAGHAVAGWFLEHASPLLKVTIVPRSKGSLGYAQYLPKEISLRTKEQIMDIVCMALAGRASEQVHFGKYTSGASDDLNKVTKIIYEMVQVYGMNEKIGQLAFPKDQGGGWPQERVYSESTAEMMDEEVRDMVAEAYQRTIDLMEEHKENVIAVAELLMKEETISHSDVARLIGERKYSAGKEYDEYLVHQKELDEEVSKDIADDEKEKESSDLDDDTKNKEGETPAPSSA